MTPTIRARLVADHAQDVLAESPEPSRAHGRILLVDDDSIVRTLLERILKQQHDVLTAQSGEEACARLAADADFDVIVCDLLMPGMSGMDVHEWVVRHRPDLAPRMVFVTGGACTPRAEAFLAGTTNPSVEKPVDRKSLLGLVERQMRCPSGGAVRRAEVAR